MKLTPNISLEELISSRTAKKRGIDNNPPDFAIENLRALAIEVLQPIRDYYGLPMTINSGFRCYRLNLAVGGSATSQHITGEAADFTIPELSRDEIMAWIVYQSELPFDQVILEPSWIHISYTMRRHPRRQALVMLEHGYGIYNL